MKNDSVFTNDDVRDLIIEHFNNIYKINRFIKFVLFQLFVIQLCLLIYGLHYYFNK